MVRVPKQRTSESEGGSAAGPAPALTVDTLQRVLRRVLVALRAMGDAALRMVLAGGVDGTGHSLQMRWVDAPSMQALAASARSGRHRKGVADVVDLQPVGDGSVEVLVAQDVSAPLWTPWSEPVLPVSGKPERPNPYPAAGRLSGDVAVEPGPLGLVHGQEGSHAVDV